MSNITKKIKNKRYKEINNRLKNLSIKEVKDYFLNQGFYPESHFLPSDFFVSTDISLRKSNDSLKKEKYFHTNPSSILFPKTQFSFRNISVPPIKNYLECVEFISNKNNWGYIKKHLFLDDSTNIIPYSFPLFYENIKRSKVGISNYKVMLETDLPRIIENFDYAIKIDIKDFYPSIYTHCISWCLDLKTNHNNKCLQSCKKLCNHRNCTCSHKCKDYWPNKLDALVRNLNLNRTKGILIGPYVSDLISEIILKKIDTEVTTALKKIIKNNYIGLRFKDDYIFFADSKSSAEKILKEVNKTLTEYHLSVNENKTSICNANNFSDDKYWKTDIEYLKRKISESFVKKDDVEEIKEKDIRLIVKRAKILFNEYGDEYILKTVLGCLVREGIKNIKIISDPEVANPHVKNLTEVYETSFSLIGSLCKLTPSSWPSFFGFVDLCFTNKTKHVIRNEIMYLLEYFIRKDETFGVVWSLYIAWRHNLKIGIKNKKRLKEKYKENWLVMSFIDPKEGIYELSNGTIIRLINTDINKIKNISEVVSVFSYPKK